MRTLLLLGCALSLAAAGCARYSSDKVPVSRDQGPGLTDARSPADGPPADGPRPDAPKPSFACVLEHVEANGNDVVAVWASATRGPFALTAGKLYERSIAGWQGYTVAAGPWTLVQARAMHGLDHWLAVASNRASGGAELALVDLDTHAVQTVVAKSTGLVADVLIQRHPADPDPTKSNVILVQPRTAHVTPVIKPALWEVPLKSLPADGTLTTVAIYKKTALLIGYSGQPAEKRGFTMWQQPLAPVWSTADIKGLAPLASWIDDTVSVLVGSPAIAAHGAPSFVTRHDLTKPKGGPARAVWARSASEIYAVGDAGLLSRYDGATWNRLQFVSGLVDDLVDVWGAAGTLWIAVSGAGGAKGRGGVLRCTLP